MPKVIFINQELPPENDKKVEFTMLMYDTWEVNQTTTYNPDDFDAVVYTGKTNGMAGFIAYVKDQPYYFWGHLNSGEY